MASETAPSQNERMNEAWYNTRFDKKGRRYLSYACLYEKSEYECLMMTSKYKYTHLPPHAHTLIS